MSGGSRARSRSPSRRTRTPGCVRTPSAVYGDRTSAEVTADVGAHAGRARATRRATSGRRSRKAEAHRPISDDEALALFRADGDALDALCRVADGLRAEAVGDDVTYVVNRNINFTNVCYVGCRFCAFAQREVDDGVLHAHARGGRRPRRGSVGRGRDRGVHAGGHPPGSPGRRSTSTCSTR